MARNWLVMNTPIVRSTASFPTRWADDRVVRHSGLSMQAGNIPRHAPRCVQLSSTFQLTEDGEGFPGVADATLRTRATALVQIGQRIAWNKGFTAWSSAASLPSAFFDFLFAFAA